MGGNTNAGAPGRLSASRIQKENVLGGATLVAYLSDPYFDGNIEYDAADDGNVKSGSGVEVFAFGNRNAYDLVLHSNGYLYGSDNGPNLNYGDRSTGCTPGQELPEIEEEDKINLLEYNRYYGHPNRKRGQTDPRQCIWHSANDPSDDDYTAPIVVGTSAIVGICEFQTNHFVRFAQVDSSALSVFVHLMLTSMLLLDFVIGRTAKCAEISSTANTKILCTE